MTTWIEATDPAWRAVRPWLRVQTYDRDGGHRHPRHRFELRDVPADLRDGLLALWVPCAHCGRAIHPVRARHGWAGALYLAVACELRACYGCARSRDAAGAYERILAALDGDSVTAPLPLLDLSDY